MIVFLITSMLTTPPHCIGETGEDSQMKTTNYFSEIPLRLAAHHYHSNKQLLTSVNNMITHNEKCQNATILRKESL